MMRTLKARSISATLILVTAIVTCVATACTRAQRMQQQPVTGAEFILEVYNPQAKSLNVSYSMGDAVTVLGPVGSRETKRWAIPNQGNDRIRIIANDPGGGQDYAKEVDLDKGKVTRWEIR